MRATSGVIQAAQIGMLSMDHTDWCLPFQLQSSATHWLHAAGNMQLMQQHEEHLVTESVCKSSSQLCP